ncbi:hypothetical protein SEA_EFFIE_260 [Acinetobacter phage Effie]|nr:hypothetical protein SEA_EFFIE_260 [Acinetobacter phage Effie]
MGGIFGTPTVSTSDTRINSMRIQQSAYGLCQPLVYGTTRVAANMFWYGDFRSYAHTTTTKSGGKGGGAKTKHTSYTYSASLMMGLCENKIASIGKIWKDRDQLIPVIVNGILLDPIDQLKFELFNGDDNLIWGYLQTKHPDQVLNYKYLGYVAAGDYDLGGSASLSNHNFEVISDITFGEFPDANPADIIEDFVKNPRYGAAPNVHIGNLEEFRTYCAAANLLFSPALIEQRDAHEIIEELVEAANCAVVPADGGFTIRTYGDTPLIANGFTFAPNLEPVYHLTDDDFIGDESPVIIQRSRDSDAYNHVQVEFSNRYNQYNTETVPASDQANIEMFGLRSEDVVNYNFICDPKIARHVAQLRLQKYLYVRNRYLFTLGWKFCRLEPMDIVRLSSELSGLSNVDVRIIQIDEDDDGQLSITAEELAIGSRSAVEYDLQSSNGYQGGSNYPGDAFAPVIFEPPLALTNGENHVWVAVAGGVDWGGCVVWVSLDDQSYEAIGTIYGAARYGRLVSDISNTSDTARVVLNSNGQLLSGTITDADSNITLIKIGDEYMSYVEADLVGVNTYDLSQLQRGKFASPTNHIVNASFARLDKAIFKYTYDPILNGRQIFFKFTSFNGLQEKEQALEDVQSYTYTLNGGAPASVKDLTLQSPFVGSSFKVQWTRSVGATKYHVQVLEGSTLKRAITTTNTDYSYTTEEAIVDGLGRNYTIRVASESYGNIGDFAELNVSNPTPAKMLNVYTSSTESAISVNWNPSEAPDLKDYAVWISTSASLDPSNVAPNWVGTALACEFRNLATTTTYYVWVCARDVWKETTWNYSDRITVSTGS